MKTYPFEGQQRTLTEICKLVPALSREALRHRVDSMGQTTIVQVLSYVPPRHKPAKHTRIQYRLGDR